MIHNKTKGPYERISIQPIQASWAKDDSVIIKNNKIEGEYEEIRTIARILGDMVLANMRTRVLVARLSIILKNARLNNCTRVLASRFKRLLEKARTIKFMPERQASRCHWQSDAATVDSCEPVASEACKMHPASDNVSCQICYELSSVLSSPDATPIFQTVSNKSRNHFVHKSIHCAMLKAGSPDSRV